SATNATPKQRSPSEHAKLPVERKSPTRSFPRPHRSVATRPAFLIWQPALQNFLQQATWNCIPADKFFSQPEDALTTKLNSLSRRPDCNSRNCRFSEFPGKTSRAFRAA
ncbi:MAG TPA: hypothetical protein VN838_27790, partial [Bradyrhizobium sp.]|nr:hypothetical protein [Bradyrhizobium sp.]